MRHCSAFRILSCAALIASCSGTESVDSAVVWGGYHVELTVTDTALMLRHYCSRAQFPVMTVGASGTYQVDGVITHTSSGVGIGLPRRLFGRISADSMFIQGANFLDGRWNDLSPPDTLVKNRQGNFTHEGSCLL